MTRVKSMEVNTTEKPLLSVVGTETLSCCDYHPEGDATAEAHPQCLRAEDAVNRASSSTSLQVPDAHLHKLPIIKTVTSHWRHPEKKTRVVRSSSTGHRHSSSERNPRRYRDPFSASQQHQTKHMRYESKNDDLVNIKPSHYRRLVVLGAPRVGKTAVIRRFLGDGFEELYEPTTEDFHSKLYHIRGERYQLDILDASKERDFPAKRRLSILTGDIFLLVFSVTDRESFNEVCSLREEVIAAKSKLKKSKENRQLPIIICGNKSDFNSLRAVHQSDVRQCLGEDSVFFEVSAKDHTKLEEMFEALAVLGGLPTETRPSHHRDISIHTYEALSNRKRNKRAIGGLAVSEPCGAVHPLARRPSFNSDLRRVMGPPTPKRSTPIERCQIQ
ncbi:dexamethasone-induced Ras-related protein 1-like [Xyrauchen texanus]|uniref:dexamethasone-induced Ras-related protein 1-like n=1 Tax=Xyrauchen texanus TaxID=154827 RepID=UPI002241E3FB|nr:dexamethasone-induced Ras-related protein 1-like [Xyrauchen texanus]